MKIKDVHRLVDELQDAFPDFYLDTQSRETIDSYFQNDASAEADLSFSDFVSMLTLLQKSGSDSPNGISRLVEELQDELENRDEQILELTDKIDSLHEDNESLKEDIGEFESREIAHRKMILDLEHRIDSLMSDLQQQQKSASVVVGRGNSEIRSVEVEELLSELKSYPVQEMHSKVAEFVEGVLQKTASIGQDRTRLYDQICSNGVGSTETVTEALSDLQSSLKLQAELLEIYDEICPCNDQLVPDNLSSFSSSTSVVSSVSLYQEKLLSIENKVNLVQNEISQVLPFPKALDSAEKCFSRQSGAFAFYSLLLWFLGILTSILVAEYMATSDWALEGNFTSNLPKILF